MKKSLLLLIIIFLYSSTSYSTPFNPTVMTITGQDKLLYDFKGGELTIPFTLTGTPAAVWLVINTKGQADNIVDVRNGYLGWHYVNKIDTTIYISQRFERNPGETSITWDGKDENGNSAEAGEYSYYLWGYDDKSSRQQASRYVAIEYGDNGQFISIIEKDSEGMPLSNPYFFGSIPDGLCTEPYINYDYGTSIYGTTFKWILGNDPMDKNLLQTTKMPIYGSDLLDVSNFFYGAPVLDPKNPNIFYNSSASLGTQNLTFHKWEFIPGGDAIRDENWLGWDNLTIDNHGSFTFYSHPHSNCITDGNYIYTGSPGNNVNNEWNKLYCVSFEGELLLNKTLHEWYFPNDANPYIDGGKNLSNGAFNQIFSRTPYKLFLISKSCCMHEMINTSRLFEDSNDDTDRIMFQNSNGDYFFDTASDPLIEPNWFCLGYQIAHTPRHNTIAIDKNGFNIIGVGYYGLASFGVSTQDGTGIGYMAFADERLNELSYKNAGTICDNGSVFDGIYYPGPLIGGMSTKPEINSAWFTAFDSFGGVLTDVVAVEDEKLNEFKVEQNVPNPFNPSTAISFSLPAKSNVSLEIFNISGQKVKTLVNGYLNGGQHSVNWDASGCSAGVYFYKIKAGKFEKTMRMTLVK